MPDWKIPPHTFGALYRHYRHGIPPGGFLAAVIANDAWLAAATADPDNKRNLSDILLFNRHAGERTKSLSKDWSAVDVLWEAWRTRYSPDSQEIEFDEQGEDE